MQLRNNAHIHLLQYWRNTLADSARNEIKVEKLIHQYNAVIDYSAGRISHEQTGILIDKVEHQQNATKGRLTKDDPEWDYLEEITILISPFNVSPDPAHTKYSGEAGTSYPFWISSVLDRNGYLKPGEDSFPYIPRTYLEPQVNEHVNFIFSDVDKIDNAFARPFADENNWTDYWRYIQTTFANITGTTLFDYTTDKHTVSFSNTIVINDILASAADGIIRLYDYLIPEKELPVLLKNLSEKSYTALRLSLATNDFELVSTRHSGQMTHSFPLSISQRKSLYHFNKLEHGEILAINGPPGTGKTTLLQSIVAGEVVKHAMKGEGPAIILACSTNNQAVTNIIDSFFSVSQKPGLLYQRWIPELNGFGLYLPAQGKTISKDVPHLKRLNGKLTGDHSDKENLVYISKSEKQFIENFKIFSGLSIGSVVEIVNHLQGILKEKQRRLEDSIRLWQQYKTIPLLIQQLNLDDDANLFYDQELNEQKLTGAETVIKNIERDISDYLDNESIWLKLFSFFRFVKDKRATRLKQLFRSCPVDYNAIDFYKISELHLFFDEKLKLLKQIKNNSRAWKEWKQVNGIHSNPPIDDRGFKKAEQNGQSFFYDELETGLKYDMFYHAIHYWEGRWLLAAREVVSENRVNKNGKEDAKKRWQRFAMLSPCFVSTFFMAPKFFTYSKHVTTGATTSTWETPPLLNFIDVLIVDEAGQVSPEIGAATFALAKKSVVVGDLWQIEPVWNVPAKVDHGNLSRYKVIDNINNEEAIAALQEKGFLSSSCSLMQLAQKASPYQLYAGMERGMMLTEHRRCFDEIITYCNTLAYNGLLEPKKGPAKNIPFAPMQFRDITGNSVMRGKSRANREEALAIAKWLKDNQQLLVDHYHAKVSEIVGIITPFTGQKYELIQVLRESGIDLSGFTIGTVHALQGAERPVILFSATYGSNDINTTNYFFDRGVNMLNVAVSRAKDTFILFGCKEIFNRKGNVPSTQLYNYIAMMHLTD